MNFCIFGPMRQLIYASAFFALFACQKDKEMAGGKMPAKFVKNGAASAVVVDPNQDFLDEFKTVKFDTLQVLAPLFAEQNGMEKRLSKDYLNLYPTGFVSSRAVDPPLYAISKFEIDKNNVGLIVQGEGRRTKTSVKLLLYNKILHKNTSYMELADHFEDKGYSDFKKTWLVRNGGKVHGFFWFQSNIKPVDHDDPTRPSLVNDYYLIKFLPEFIDTLRISPKDMAAYTVFINEKKLAK